MRNIIVCAFVWLLAISCSNFEQNNKVNQLLTAPEIIYAEFDGMQLHYPKTFEDLLDELGITDEKNYK